MSKDNTEYVADAKVAADISAKFVDVSAVTDIKPPADAAYADVPAAGSFGEEGTTTTGDDSAEPETPEAPAADEMPPELVRAHAILDVVIHELPSAMFELVYTVDGAERRERLYADRFMLMERLRDEALPNELAVVLNNYTGHEKLGTCTVTTSVGELREVLPQLVMPYQTHLGNLLNLTLHGYKHAGMRLSLLVCSYADGVAEQQNEGVFVQARCPAIPVLKAMPPAVVQRFLDTIMETHAQLTKAYSEHVALRKEVPNLVIVSR